MSNIRKEFESRIMLTENEYFMVVSHFMKSYPNSPFLQITNIYFDTKDLYLKNNHMTLRLRITNDASYELTLKIKGSNGDDEINDTLTKRGYDLLANNNIFPEGNVRNYLLSLPYSLDNFQKITTLHNRRLEIPIDNYLIVLDRNSYSDVIDYNLEVESQDSINSANRVLTRYIDQFNLSLVGQKYSGKSHRAIARATNKN